MHKHFCCSSPCSCLFLVQQMQHHFVVPAELFTIPCFLPICMLFPRFSLFSKSRIRQRKRDMIWTKLAILSFVPQLERSKYRVSNKLETVKLGKSKIRKAIFFCYSEAQVFHYLGCGRIGSLDGKLNCT